MTAKKELKNLIRLFHERQVVEKIAESKGSLSVYEEQKNILNKELETFKAKAEEILRTRDYIIDNTNDVILPEDALQICFICIMTEINDFALFKSYKELPIALRQIEGELAKLAEIIAYFISSDGENDMFSCYQPEELLEKFF